ncbi:hypothetical protein A3C86_01450 [Candidatus Kaiserbacteria bacterium RIFCSPHIGHO2_02_FULL_49_16]|nr:MAG: hypothetical protein A3C86_01450 [Candidatus Kaiserbacteria bacterium RIFCSPHIGHO2_02_FULL_49_16]
MDVLREFERATGAVAFVYKAPVGKALEVLGGCVQVDLVVLPSSAMEKARVRNWVRVSGPFVDLGGSGVGFFIGPSWEGPAPDVSYREGLMEALEAAESIGVTDPKLGSGGRIVMNALEHLGPDDPIRRKIRLFPSGDATFKAAAEEQTMVALGLVCEGLATHGLELAGSLPPGMNQVTQYMAGMSQTVYVQNEGLVGQLLDLLKRSRQTFVAHGLDEEPDQ